MPKAATLPPMKAQAEYTSTGMLCQLCQRSPHKIREAAELLGLVPALRLNSIAHYDAGQVDQLMAHFAAEPTKTRLVAADRGERLVADHASHEHLVAKD